MRQPEQGKGKHYAEWQAEQDGKPSYHSMVKADVDEAIRKARTENSSFLFAGKRILFKFGKDITICPEGRERGLKLKRNFGENYSLEAIRVRILEENELPAEKKFPVQRHYRIRISGNFKQTRKSEDFGIVSALLLSFRNPTEEPPVNVCQTNSCIVPRGFIKTEYHFQRDKAALPLSHRYCRAAFFVERKFAEENGAVCGGTEALAL